jgi:type VI secretion system secreted protein VgrG
LAGYTQTNRLLAFISPLGANKLLAIKFHGVEEISELFNYEVEVLAEPDTVIAPAALVGKRVTLELQVTDTGIKRYFNGIVASIEGTGGDRYFNSYRIRVVPMLWLLSLNQQTRVFQDMSVLDIARKVLTPYSIVPRIETQGSYTTLEYCTQYRETDLQFLRRILEQQGIFFYFSHTEADHVLILSDASSLCGECLVVSDFDFATEAERQLGFYKPVVLGFRSRSALVPGELTTWDYRFMEYALSHASPETARSVTEMGENSHELYDFADSAAAFFKTEGAEPKTSLMQTLLQNVARDVSDAQSVRCEGESTASTMQAGFAFTLNKFPQTEKNTKYLITRVVHSAHQRPGYRSEVSSAEEEPYINSFEARPFVQTFRKEQTIPKPRVSGVVTGKVVTFPGEDSYLDRFGRVCVQFWWDRQRPSQTPDKTLLRVAQSWAGKGWGTYFWPRIGDEVLIDFIEGDPDAPIVVGSLYNGINMPKYDPKSEPTRSGILTRSSKGGGPANANELRIDDLKGSEQIFMNAERDFDLHVEHDWHIRVDNEEHKHIAQHQYHCVEGQAHLRIGGEQVFEVDGDRSTTVRGNQTSEIGGNCFVSVGENQIHRTGLAHHIESGEEVHIKGGVRVILEGGIGGICLKSAESAISIDATGITLQGPMRFGMADCLPATPEPPPQIKQPIPPLWPGDDPRK